MVMEAEQRLRGVCDLKSSPRRGLSGNATATNDPSDQAVSEHWSEGLVWVTRQPKLPARPTHMGLGSYIWGRGWGLCAEGK